jgi:excisionase family DNA binding protein
MTNEKRIEDILPRDNGTRPEPSTPRGIDAPGGVRARESEPVRAQEGPPELARARGDDDAASALAAREARPPREARPEPQRDILDIDQAAELLGVSIKTFNKVLHAQNMPARKIGREWKFSRQALIDWVGSGRSQDFYREAPDTEDEEHPVEIQPASAPASEKSKTRRTAGWQIEMD